MCDTEAMLTVADKEESEYDPVLSVLVQLLNILHKNLEFGHAALEHHHFWQHHSFKLLCRIGQQTATSKHQNLSRTSEMCVSATMFTVALSLHFRNSDHDYIIVWGDTERWQHLYGRVGATLSGLEQCLYSCFKGVDGMGTSGMAD